MSPTAEYSQLTSSASPISDNVLTKGSALVIGSLTTAQDGQYQTLISTLEENRQVERQILDRLMDGGE